MLAGQVLRHRQGRQDRARQFSSDLDHQVARAVAAFPETVGSCGRWLRDENRRCRRSSAERAHRLQNAASRWGAWTREHRRNYRGRPQLAGARPKARAQHFPCRRSPPAAGCGRLASHQSHVRCGFQALPRSAFPPGFPVSLSCCSSPPNDDSLLCAKSTVTSLANPDRPEHGALRTCHAYRVSRTLYARQWQSPSANAWNLRNWEHDGFRSAPN